jgi:hypothetical protein
VVETIKRTGRKEDNLEITVKVKKERKVKKQDIGEINLGDIYTFATDKMHVYYKYTKMINFDVYCNSNYSSK